MDNKEKEGKKGETLIVGPYTEREYVGTFSPNVLPQSRFVLLVEVEIKFSAKETRVVKSNLQEFTRTLNLSEGGYSVSGKIPLFQWHYRQSDISHWVFNAVNFLSFKFANV